MEILWYGFPAVLIVMALTQIAKRFIKNRWMPVIAIIFGVVLASLAAWEEWTIKALFVGIIVGLSACGLFDLGKKSIGKKSVVNK